MLATAISGPLRGGAEILAGPMLLDTCVLQHLLLVMEMMGEEWEWPPEADAYLSERFGATTAADLIALGELVALWRSSGPPWVVSATSLYELGRAAGGKGRRLREWWTEWACYWQESRQQYMSGSEDGSPLPMPRVFGQLELPLASASAQHSRPRAAPRPGWLKDAGDWAIVCDAVRMGLQAILTTDLKTFWCSRRALQLFGIRVWKPAELWETMRHEDLSGRCPLIRCRPPCPTSTCA